MIEFWVLTLYPWILLNSFLCCAHLCLTVCNFMDCSPSGSSVHEFPKQEYWSGLPWPSPGDFPDHGIKPASLTSLALAGRFFTTSTTCKVP